MQRATLHRPPRPRPRVMTDSLPAGPRLPPGAGNARPAAPGTAPAGARTCAPGTAFRRPTRGRCRASNPCTHRRACPDPPAAERPTAPPLHRCRSMLALHPCRILATKGGHHGRMRLHVLIKFIEAEQPFDNGLPSLIATPERKQRRYDDRQHHRIREGRLPRLHAPPRVQNQLICSRHTSTLLTAATAPHHTVHATT